MSAEWPPPDIPRVLTAGNIDAALTAYRRLVQTIEAPSRRLRGAELLWVMKRSKLGRGPYPNVSLFEAANRVMTDLVLLTGVRWLLKERVFSFRSYTVQYGHANEAPYDVEAHAGRRSLAAEVFNVAQSYFATKKAAALKKLRASRPRPTVRLLMFNHDAVAAEFAPKPRAGEHVLIVNVGSRKVRYCPPPT